MRVLITIERRPAQKYLVRLYTKALIQEIRNLINQKRHSQAIATAFAKGTFERNVSEDEINAVEADLILSEKRASWDLT